MKLKSIEDIIKSLPFYDRVISVGKNLLGNWVYAPFCHDGGNEASRVTRPLINKGGSSDKNYEKCL